MSDPITLAWERFERGRAFNNSLTPNQYDLVHTNVEFYAGNQWVHLAQTPAMQKLPKPVFNIIKRITALFVASLTSTAATLSFAPLTEYGEGGEEAEIATAEIRNLMDKFKMEFRIREALFDGAQTGDYCAHFYWDAAAIPYGGALHPHRGAIKMELVDGINVLFGDPSTPRVDDQPYILIAARESVRRLAREAGADPEDITPDSERLHPVGADPDGEEQALCLYMYEKDGDTVRLTKATRHRVIYEGIDTGLSRYPIAWGNWERQKNLYHGRALVTGIIPNQIFINSMFAMVMRHLQLMGFPKTVYNADLISQWTNEVGQAIGVRGLMPGQSISQVAYNLQPADMSAQIIQAIDKAVAYTKDCLGATDVQLGNVRPDNTSAIMVLQSAAAIPLENIRAGLYEWLEDVGGILLDMIGTYYGLRPVVRTRRLEEPVTDPATGAPVLEEDGRLRTEQVSRRVLEEYDFTRFKSLWFDVQVNAGAASYYSEVAMVQTLDNLRREGVLEMAEYLERLPDELLPRKGEVVERLKRDIAKREG